MVSSSGFDPDNLGSNPSVPANLGVRLLSGEWRRTVNPLQGNIGGSTPPAPTNMGMILEKVRKWYHLYKVGSIPAVSTIFI